jgi:hypothetical protein
MSYGHLIYSQGGNISMADINAIYTEVKQHILDNISNIVPGIDNGNTVTSTYFEYHMSFEVMEQLQKYLIDRSTLTHLFNQIMKDIVAHANAKGLVV